MSSLCSSGDLRTAKKGNANVSSHPSRPVGSEVGRGINSIEMRGIRDERSVGEKRFEEKAHRNSQLCSQLLREALDSAQALERTKGLLKRDRSLDDEGRSEGLLELLRR